MSTVPKYEPSYTIADYQQWEGDWELWSGIPVSMSPSAGFRHQSLAARLVAMVLNELDKHQNCEKCQVVTECDWHVNESTVVRPDVFLTCQPPSGLFPEQAPVFIAEIFSPSTAHKDRTAKKDLYESEGVRYYAIVDPDNQSVILYERSKQGVFCLSENAGDGPVPMALTDQCSIEIDFRELF